MIVSYNELFSAVEKAFRGEQRLCGEADIIAAMVVDLQMLGLDGVRQFNQASRCYGWGPDNAMQYPMSMTISLSLTWATVVLLVIFRL